MKMLQNNPERVHKYLEHPNILLIMSYHDAGLII